MSGNWLTSSPPVKEVEWTSQIAPTSLFDIRTLRRTPDGTVLEHFLEVKSSAMSGGENVSVSSGQVEFLQQKGGARRCA